MKDETLVNAYNTIVGALDHAVKQGTFDLSEIAQVIPALDYLTKHVNEFELPEEEDKPGVELGPDSVGA